MSAIKVQYEYGNDPKGMGFFWPEAPSKRVEYLKAKKNRPGLAEAIYQCNPGALEGDIFKVKDFRYFIPPPRLSDGIAYNLGFVAPSDMLVQSWDTAFSDSKESNYTVCTTAMLVPCTDSHGIDNTLLKELMGEDNDPHYDVYILDVYREKLEFGDLLNAAMMQYHKWRPSAVLIEKKATGAPLLSILEQKSLPVTPVEPGSMSKRSRAVHGVAAGSTQGWVQQHRVWFPKTALWLENFEIELKNFSGNDDAEDDQVDSFVQLCNFAIENGSVVASLPTDTNLSNYQQGVETPTPLGGLGELGSTSEIPHICQFCIYYNKEGNKCIFHQRPTLALDSCDDFDTKDSDGYYH